jgi:hypothetical protein
VAKTSVNRSCFSRHTEISCAGNDLRIRARLQAEAREVSFLRRAQIGSVAQTWQPRRQASTTPCGLRARGFKNTCNHDWHICNVFLFLTPPPPPHTQNCIYLYMNRLLMFRFSNELRVAVNAEVFTSMSLRHILKGFTSKSVLVGIVVAKEAM